MWNKWLLFIFLSPFTASILTHDSNYQSKDISRVKRATGSCNAGWTSIGSYCYKTATVTTYSILSFDNACATMNSTLATFPTLQDYQDLYNYWLTMPGLPNAVIGYYHLRGTAAYSDIGSVYSEQQMPFPSQFCGGEPSFGGEWCVALWKQYKCLNDVPCEDTSLVPVCQQKKTYDPSVSNISCSPVCRSLTPSGHMYSISLNWMCKNAGTVENTTVAYAMTQYIPGMSEFLYEMKSTSGNYLMVYGQQGMASLNSSYTYQRSFIVATVKSSASMDEYVLMKNPQENDTLICQTYSSLCPNLSSQSWTPQAIFYMFN